MVQLKVSPTSFAVTFDYRCPFARNAHEHVLTALESGAPYDVEFLPFSLNQAHVEDGGTPVWDDPARSLDLLAGEVGVVVRDKFPDAFLKVHRRLFALRHDDGRDLRDKDALAEALRGEGVDPGEVFAEVDDGWPLEVFRKQHEAGVADYQVFGVPTFIAGGNAAFVRIMTRPDGDGALADATLRRVLDLVVSQADLNEVKHSSIPR